MSRGWDEVRGGQRELVFEVETSVGDGDGEAVGDGMVVYLCRRLRRRRRSAIMVIVIRRARRARPIVKPMRADVLSDFEEGSGVVLEEFGWESEGSAGLMSVDGEGVASDEVWGSGVIGCGAGDMELVDDCGCDCDCSADWEGLSGIGGGIIGGGIDIERPINCVVENVGIAELG
jgi:hypothetical protein